MSFRFHLQSKLLPVSKAVNFLLGAVLAIGALNPVLASDTSPTYQVTHGIAGTIISVGSDTMSNLTSVWAEEFNQHYPQVKFQLQAAGSSTAPPAMTHGTANIGPMSRTLKASERDAFFNEFGYEPTLVPVALDAITLFVSLDNPATVLTQQQIDAIFSVTRFCGGREAIDNWSQVLPDGQFVQRIKMFGRSAVSGTYGLFKDKILCNGDFKAQVAEQPSSTSVVQSVAFFKGAIGYAGWGFQNAGIKLLSVKLSTHGEAVAPTEANIRSGNYPYSRFLYLLINKKPNEPLADPYLEFVRFIYSAEGDAITRREGYVPLGAARSTQVLSLLEAAE